MKGDSAKILLFDLESTGLTADFATLLVFGYKWAGEHGVHTPSILDTRKRGQRLSDEFLVRQAHEVLSGADMWVTYYGKRFDVPFLQAKFLELDMTPLPNTPHVDLYFIARDNLALKSRRMANVADFLWPGKGLKTPLLPSVWRNATHGDEKSIRYIIRHCQHDVQELERLYFRMRPLVRTHPRVAWTKWPCRVCGGEVVSRGRAMTVLAGPRRRVQCKNCGAWETRTG